MARRPVARGIDTYLDRKRKQLEQLGQPAPQSRTNNKKRAVGPQAAPNKARTHPSSHLRGNAVSRARAEARKRDAAAARRKKLGR